jgi:hypothetical protein
MNNERSKAIDSLVSKISRGMMFILVLSVLGFTIIGASSYNRDSQQPKRFLKAIMDKDDSFQSLRKEIAKEIQSEKVVLSVLSPLLDKTINSESCEALDYFTNHSLSSWVHFGKYCKKKLAANSTEMIDLYEYLETHDHTKLKLLIETYSFDVEVLNMRLQIILDFVIKNNLWKDFAQADLSQIKLENTEVSASRILPISNNINSLALFIYIALNVMPLYILANVLELRENVANTNDIKGLFLFWHGNRLSKLICLIWGLLPFICTINLLNLVIDEQGSFYFWFAYFELMKFSFVGAPALMFLYFLIFKNSKTTFASIRANVLFVVFRNKLVLKFKIFNGIDSEGIKRVRFNVKNNASFRGKKRKS